MTPSAVARTPEEVLGLTAGGADRLLDALERIVPVRSPWTEIAPEGVRRAIVFGDTHGDWRSTRLVAEEFLADPSTTALIGLGDYVDRAPPDCGEGSVANLLYLLGLAADHPDRVWLLQGNHETARRLPVLPHDLPEEVDQLWGPEQRRYDRLLALAERGPAIARTASGVLLAHAGFPRSARWRQELTEGQEAPWLDCVWASCAASALHRAAAPSFTEAELEGFLAQSGARLFLRGHDPDIAGRWVFRDRVLTLHTCRAYERYGGVITADIPMDRQVGGAPDVRVRHVATEGRRYGEPEVPPPG